MMTTPSPISADPQGSPGGLSDDERELRRLAEAATPGPWETGPQESEDGRGKYWAYAVFGPDGKTLADTQNSDAAEIQQEVDEDGTHAWDEVGRCNAAYIAAANPQAVLGLLDALAAAREALRRLLDLSAHPPGPDFIDWVADRLIRHGDDPNVDFVQALRRKADEMRAARAHLPQARADEEG